MAKRKEVVMADEQAYIDSWQSPFRKDPFEIPLETQLALLLAADAEMRRVKGVTLTETDMQFRKIGFSWFASSIGSRIHQRKVISGCGIVRDFVSRARKFRSGRIRIVLAGSMRCRAMSWSSRWSWLRMRRVIAEEAVALHRRGAVSGEDGHADSGREPAGIADS